MRSHWLFFGHVEKTKIKYGPRRQQYSKIVAYAVYNTKLILSHSGTELLFDRRLSGSHERLAHDYIVSAHLRHWS